MKLVPLKRGRTHVVNALVPTNATVMAVAKRLKFRPETLCERTKKVLPNVVEQHFYLNLAKEFPLHPETFKKMLFEYLGDQELQPDDVFTRSIGKNLVVNKINDLADFAREVMLLIGKIIDDHKELRLSVKSASRLVLAYGSHASEILESIQDNLDEIADRLHMGKYASKSAITQRAIKLIVDSVSGDVHAGRPHCVDIMEFFAHDEEIRRTAVAVFETDDIPEEG